MYYPSSQIKPNLYTNGGEYILSTTKQDYKGYYYELANGKRYTGKSPQDGPNILIIPKPNIPEPGFLFQEGQGEKFLTSKSSPIISSTPYNQNPPTVRFLPQYNPTTPTQNDYNLGVFQRYFCKKNNELRYIEIDKTTYGSLQSHLPTIAWDLYSPLYTLWYIKGNKEQTYKANKGLISLIEQNEKWYGFSQYLKEDYLKYYLGS
jgi:hypothetical protein